MKLINPEDIRFEMRPIFIKESSMPFQYEWVAFRGKVNQIPRIEAEPVRHAHWIEGNEDHVSCDSVCYYTCSECKHSFSDDTPYCPHCGAKMDEEITGGGKDAAD